MAATEEILETSSSLIVDKKSMDFVSESEENHKKEGTPREQQQEEGKKGGALENDNGAIAVGFNKDLSLRKCFITKLEQGPPTEVMAILSFADSRFLEMCLRVLASSSSPPQSINHETEYENSPCFGWKQLVNYSTQEAENNKENGAHEKMEASDFTSGAERDDVASLGGHDDGSSRSTATPDDTEDHDSQANKFLLTLIEHLVVLVPGAWKQSETIPDEGLCITLNATNKFAVLSALDGLSRYCFHRRFLDRDEKGNGPIMDAAWVPLYALLLTRFEKAVQRAFDERKPSHSPQESTGSGDTELNLGAIPIPFSRLRSFFVSEPINRIDWKELNSKITLAIATNQDHCGPLSDSAGEVKVVQGPATASPDSSPSSQQADINPQPQDNNSNNLTNNKKRAKKKKKKKNKNKAVTDGTTLKNGTTVARGHPEPEVKESPKGSNSKADKPVVLESEEPVSPPKVPEKNATASSSGTAKPDQFPTGKGKKLAGAAISSSVKVETKPEVESPACADSSVTQPIPMEKDGVEQTINLPPQPSTLQNVTTAIPSTVDPNSSSKGKVVEGSNPPQKHHLNDNEWETVSARSRGRKAVKANYQQENKVGSANTAFPQQQQQPNHDAFQRNNKTHPTNNNNNSSSSNSKGDHHHHRGHRNYYHSFRARKNNATRKIAREILFSLLDTVDDEVKNHVKPPSTSVPSIRASQASEQEAKTTQDSVSVKKTPMPPTDNQRSSAPPSSTSNTVSNAVPTANRGARIERSVVSLEPDKEKTALPEGSSPTLSNPGTPRCAPSASPPADQNTAPTYQETSSAYTTTSNTLPENHVVKSKETSIVYNTIPSSGHPSAVKNGGGVGGVSADGVDAATHPSDVSPENTSSNHKMHSLAPPLPTLLSPENANSTTSSVASSLEAPHSRPHHRHHHPPSQEDQNAVGYHLLDVCDRLSKDMALFMKSRAQALSFRRIERSVLLGALQKVVSGLWRNSCRVEMYGSCATLLDLPSSDLDVVVVGLDHRSSGIFPWGSTADLATPTAATRSQSDAPSPMKSSATSPSTQSYMPAYSANGHRVMKLAAEIERMPWAVKVKSIPNAAVPVIKILADPSKIPGFSTVCFNEWQGYGTGPSQHDFAGSPASNATSVPSQRSPTSKHVYQPWRGSDVMNGLISLDITFQGPEHGGIGSTEYSRHVVSQACQEAGVDNPDDTAFVQCLMVLKELLAQRKLNEPYSGGLSSYALILLLTALLRERAAIREEIELLEQHRNALMIAAAADRIPPLPLADTAIQCSPQMIESNPSEVEQGRVNDLDKNTDTEGGRRTPLAKGTSGSWASVARNKEAGCSDDTGLGNESQTITPHSRNGGELQDEQKPISFADAVSKSSSSYPTNSSAASQRGPSSRRPHAKKEKKTHHKSPDLSSHDIYSSRHSNIINGHNNCGGSSSMVKSFPEIVPQQQQQQDHSFLPTFFPQGFDDVIEVLCLGETTSGKLLMHFLLHYGQYFDSTITAIDISGKHERILTAHPTPYFYLTPYIQRSAPESIDPHTGMLVVDHIVIYDPLEGAEKHNVARRCFAWPQVRWIFAQSYATLSRAVEKSASARSPPVTHPMSGAGYHAAQSTRAAEIPNCSKDALIESEMPGDLDDPSSPLLRCLLSF